MKFQWDKKYTAVAVYCFIVILACGSAFLLMLNFKAVGNFFSWIFGILSPFIGGVVVAYMLNPIVMMLESHFLKRIPKKKTRRGVALFLTYSFALFLLTALIMNIIPQLQESITKLISNSKTYIDNINNYFLDFAEDNPWLKEPFNAAADYLEEFINNSGTLIKNVVPTVMTITTSVSNIVIAIIASIYLLSAKELMLAQSRKIIFAVFKKSFADRILEIASFANDCFSKFISGQIYVSFITGTLTVIVATIMGAPFPIIMGFIIGITNIIPMFGPIIGSILCIFITLLVDPMLAIGFGIFIIILQQVDSNIISPRIIGSRVGLSPFWVMFSIIVFGALFGFAGLVFGVPLFTVIYTVTRIMVKDKLAEREMPVSSDSFYEDYKIENNRFKVPEEIKKQRMGDSPIDKLAAKLKRKKSAKETPDKDEKIEK